MSNELRQEHLGHPNSKILSYLLKFGLLNKKVHSSPIVFSDCTTCKLDKSKILPCPSKDSKATHNFKIIHSDVYGVLVL